MSGSNKVETIARRSAARLSDIDPGLLGQVERALAEDPLAQPNDRAFDPISLGALIVSIASLGWTVYRDIKKDRAVAGLDQAPKAERLAVRMQEDGVEIARLPARVTPEQHGRIIRVIAAEIVAADLPPTSPRESE